MRSVGATAPCPRRHSMRRAVVAGLVRVQAQAAAVHRLTICKPCGGHGRRCGRPRILRHVPTRVQHRDRRRDMSAVGRTGGMTTARIVSRKRKRGPGRPKQTRAGSERAPRGPGSDTLAWKGSTTAAGRTFEAGGTRGPMNAAVAEAQPPKTRRTRTRAAADHASTAHRRGLGRRRRRRHHHRGAISSPGIEAPTRTGTDPTTRKVSLVPCVATIDGAVNLSTEAITITTSGTRNMPKTQAGTKNQTARRPRWKWPSATPFVLAPWQHSAVMTCRADGWATRARVWLRQRWDLPLWTHT